MKRTSPASRVQLLQHVRVQRHESSVTLKEISSSNVHLLVCVPCVPCVPCVQCVHSVYTQCTHAKCLQLRGEYRTAVPLECTMHVDIVYRELGLE